MEDTSLGESVQESVQSTVEELGFSPGQLKTLLNDHLPELVSFGMRVVLAIVVFWIGRKVIHWIVRILKKSLGRTGIDQGVSQFLGSLTKVVLYIFLGFNIATYFGVTESSVAALLGTAGVTIGLALQGSLANLAGGVLLLVFKPFQVGDYIVSGENEGTVSKIEICYTTLLSVDNRRVVIPNGELSNGTIVNVTAQDRRKLEIKVGVSYDSDLQMVKQVLERLLREDPDIIKDQEILVFVDELGESSVIVGFRAWVSTDRYWPAKWRMNEKIKTEFDREGIKIPYPQLEVKIN